ASPVTVGAAWSLAVCVFTRNSDPTLLPFAPNTCALMLQPLLSPSVPLVSCHVTTNPPFDSLATAEENWLFAVCVFTKTSDPRRGNGPVSTVTLNGVAVLGKPSMNRAVSAYDPSISAPVCTST